MVSPKQAVPSFFFQSRLPFFKELLQLRQRIRFRIPVSTSDAVDSHQFKLKNHTELLAFRIRILLCHFYRSTSGFPHCQDLF